MISRLNFYDLLYMLTDLRISEMKQYFRQKRQQELHARGIESEAEATPEQAAQYFRRGG